MRVWGASGYINCRTLDAYGTQLASANARRRGARAARIWGRVERRRPLRIAFSSYYLPSESKIGAGCQAHGLAQAMVRVGHDVTMFSPCAKPDGALYAHVKVEVHKPLATFRWALALRRQDLTSFDVFPRGGRRLLVHGQDPPRARAYHARLMHGRGNAHSRDSPAPAHGRARAGRGAGDHGCGPDGVGAETTRKWFPWVRTVIPNGVDLGRFHPGDHERARADDPVRWHLRQSRKNAGKLLMDVFADQVRPTIPNAKLWMVCSDAPEAPGVERVLGRLSDEELADSYRRAWVLPAEQL